MNETNKTENDSSMPRRTFLNWLWAGLGIVATAEFGWLGISFLQARKERSRPAATERIITAGPLERFAPQTVTAIPQGAFYLACLQDGSLLALSRTCTHLGCSVLWDEDKDQFVCPCHGSSFNLTGGVLTAPAPRPLDIYPVRIENNLVKVDVGAPQKRDHFEPAQASRLS